MYLMNIVAELQVDLAWLGDLGWFRYLTTTELIDSGAVPWSSIAVFGAVAVVGWAASLIVFRRRDLLA
jgi:ABC-type transport system involved in multi-copper enzyme maturation permease subunit